MEMTCHRLPAYRLVHHHTRKPQSVEHCYVKNLKAAVRHFPSLYVLENSCYWRTKAEKILTLQLEFYPNSSSSIRVQCLAPPKLALLWRSGNRQPRVL
ncbi:hypothetical protein VNO77_22880 [Canavalia gladiata]|uniref:Uncharacterized protein n=1 Tax=Canavalia gladiata TaxID=3824 RepID=A0AAN9QB00_CANGL